MGWFSRRKKDSSAVDNISADTLIEDAAGLDAAAEIVEDTYRINGPWDLEEVADTSNLVDIGSLLIPPLEGAKLQFTSDLQQQNIIGVVYIKDGSALQLQAFAAPKSHGIWDEVRLDMRSAVAQQGGSSQEVVGPFGKELEAQMPLPDSPKFAPHRYLGIDGPRWLLRVTLYGKAGYDKKAANDMLSVLEKLVVNRGEEPYPPRELLPLELPKGSSTVREIS